MCYVLFILFWLIIILTWTSLPAKSADKHLPVKLKEKKEKQWLINISFLFWFTYQIVGINSNKTQSRSWIVFKISLLCVILIYWNQLILHCISAIISTGRGWRRKRNMNILTTLRSFYLLYMTKLCDFVNENEHVSFWMK